MMKIDCSRQVWTDERTEISISWAPVGAKKDIISNLSNVPALQDLFPRHIRLEAVEGALFDRFIHLFPFDL